MKAVNQKPATSHNTFKTDDVKPFRLEIRIRGRADLMHKEVCYGLEDAVRAGEKWFRAFAASRSLSKSMEAVREQFGFIGFPIS
jgi:hypothetical protein